MSFGPQVVMPGAFHFEAPNGGSSLSGVHPGLFRPPMSPSASSSCYLGRSTGSLHSDTSTPGLNVKRKRQPARESTPLNDWTIAGDTSSNTVDATDGRPQAGRQISGGGRRYVMAGQIETPGAAQRNIGDLDGSVYSDVDYRRALVSNHPLGGVDAAQSEQTETPRLDGQVQRTHGWSSFAMNTLGGVVGKVWQFCTAGAFRGFHAGGGAGYEIHVAPGPSSPSNGHVWYNEHDVPTLPGYGPSPLPGGFPESDYSPFYYERETPESTPPPAPKRRQINDGTPNDELRRNWIVVNEPAEKKMQSGLAPRASTGNQPRNPTAPPLTRRMSKPVSRLSAPSFNRQHSDRISHAGSASLSNREPASFASPRSPGTSQTPSRLPVPSRPQTPSAFSSNRLSQQPTRMTSPSPYAKHGHRRTTSAASAASAAPGRMRKRESLQDVQNSSPRLDPEAKKIAARRMKEEMETDLRINDFNAKLRDMIRQGKEALGTTIEVDLDDDDGAGGVDPWEDA